MLNGLSGNFKNILKRILPNFLLDFLKSVFYAKKKKLFIQNFKREITYIHQKGHAIIIMATPVHGNLGDHAIVYAEKCLLTDIGFGENIIEIAAIDYALCKKQIRKYVSDQDLVIIDGGGNLGTLWPWEDDKISEIINTYWQNPIVLFPQTCFYEDSFAAMDRLKRNRIVYSKANRLLITLRDRKSFTFCCTHFSGKRCSLVPDIVLYLSGKLKQTSLSGREGVLLCFRKDVERLISQEDVERLKAYLRQQKILFTEISTVKDYDVDRFFFFIELNKIWEEFASVRLVITDRLHGMIFAAINGTPCLALDNISQKVSGVYETVPELDGVKFCTDIDEVMKNILSYYKGDFSFMETKGLESNYQLLKNFIKENI